MRRNELDALAATAIKNFAVKYPEMKDDMMKSKHYYNNIPNQHHLEDDVWTHTLLTIKEFVNGFHWVCDNTLFFPYMNNKDFSKIGILLCLLHDIGKTRTLSKDDEKNKCSFRSHESMSAVMSSGYINGIFDSFDVYTNYKLISEVICYHLDLFHLEESFTGNEKKSINKFITKHGYDLNFYFWLYVLRHCDTRGRFFERINEDDTTMYVIMDSILKHDDIIKNNDEKFIRMVSLVVDTFSI